MNSSFFENYCSYCWNEKNRVHFKQFWLAVVSISHNMKKQIFLLSTSRLPDVCCKTVRQISCETTGLINMKFYMYFTICFSKFGTVLRSLSRKWPRKCMTYHNSVTCDLTSHLYFTLGMHILKNYVWTNTF